MPDPQPPSYLQAPGKSFWRDIVKVYKLPPQDLRRLEICCDCLDRIAQARKVLADGFDRAAMNAWRDSAKVFLSATRAMGIDADPEGGK